MGQAIFSARMAICSLYKIALIKNGDIVRLGDGYEYLITAKFDGNNFTDVIVDKKHLVYQT